MLWLHPPKKVLVADLKTAGKKQKKNTQKIRDVRHTIAGLNNCSGQHGSHMSDICEPCNMEKNNTEHRRSSLSLLLFYSGLALEAAELNLKHYFVGAHGTGTTPSNYTAPLLISNGPELMVPGVKCGSQK